MQLTTREASRIFRKLEVEEKRSTHHVAGFVVIDGKKVLPVHYSRGRKDMKGPVPRRFSRSLCLSDEEFALLKSCTMSRAEYVQILRDRGVA